MRTATAPALPDNHHFRHLSRTDPAGLGFTHQLDSGNLFMVLVFASMALGSPMTVDQSAGADRLTADPII